MKKENDNENDFFEEDNKKNVVIRAIITICAFLVLIAGVSVGVLTANKNKKADTDKDVNESIREYAESSAGDEDNENEGAKDIIKRDEDSISHISISTATPFPTDAPVGTPEPDKPVMEDTKDKDYSKIKFDSKRNLSEMEAYFKDDNDKALWDLAYLDRYIAMSYSLKDTTDYIYYGDVNAGGEPDGMGIAVYADNEYYYGEWKDGVRSGAGRWLHFHIHNTENTDDIIYFHQFTGTFRDDMPNGAGQDHYEYNLDMLDKNVHYITNYISSYKDGLIDGEVYCTSTEWDGKYYDWVGEAKSGAFIYISEARDASRRGPVMTDRENPDNYIWLNAYENQKIGVKNYISENK